MPDYSKSKIYTIRSRKDENLIYVGSTTEKLCVRWAKHKHDFIKQKQISFINYIYENNLDFNDFYIELYEDFSCQNREQLNRREGEIIRLIGSLNYRIEGRTKKEYIEDN